MGGVIDPNTHGHSCGTQEGVKISRLTAENKTLRAAAAKMTEKWHQLYITLNQVMAQKEDYEAQLKNLEYNYAEVVKYVSTCHDTIAELSNKLRRAETEVERYYHLGKQKRGDPVISGDFTQGYTVWRWTDDLMLTKDPNTYKTLYDALESVWAGN